jgi:hypothetical protein
MTTMPMRESVMTSCSGVVEAGEGDHGGRTRRKLHGGDPSIEGHPAEVHAQPVGRETRRFNRVRPSAVRDDRPGDG